MKNTILTFFTIIILVIVGWFSYVAYDYIEEKNSLQFTPIPSPETSGTSTAAIGASTSADAVATTTVDTSLWKVLNNDELGYGFKYPATLIVNDGGTSFILSFPKKTFFHWPLEDEFKVTVIASSTCPSATLFADYVPNVATSTFTVKGKKFARSEITDIGAGNVYKKTTYEILGNNSCYSFVVDSHGTNGSGFYVNDPVMIKKYDDQHLADVSSVQDIVVGMLGSFNLRSTPDGTLEN